jgi:iron complex outermembrane recepter protein
VGLRPVVAESREAGARGELLGRLGYSLAAYRMRVENDVLSYIHPDGTRETQNAGETLHQGVEVGLGAALTRELRAEASYSLARHTYEQWRPNAQVDFSGNRMESAPAVLLNTRLSYRPDFLPRSRFALEWARIGGYWMDPENTHRYEGHGLVNLHANLPVAGDWELMARVLNLADTRFAEGASYTRARGEEFAPGMPRSLYLGVQYRWRQEAGR